MNLKLGIQEYSDNRIKIPYKEIFAAICMASFFEPTSFNLLAAKGVNVTLNHLIGYVYLAVMLAVSTWSLLRLVTTYQKEEQRGIIKALLLMDVIALIISVCLSGTVAFNSIKNFYCRMGFVAFCYNKIADSFKGFLKSGIICFGVLSAVGSITILVFPGGFLNANKASQAIFALGSKNSGYCFYFYFLAFLLIYYYMEGKNLKKAIPWVALFIICSRVCDSGNTFVNMALLLVFLLFFNGFSISRLVRPGIILTAILVIALMIYGGTQTVFMQSVVSLLNRSITFSGRIFVWADAFEYFLSSPIYGSGDGILFHIKNSTVQHGHSEYLNCLAKYGIIPFILLILMIVILAVIINKVKDQGMKTLLSMLMFINLLHMAFDVYNFNFTILMMVIFDATARYYSRVETREEGGVNLAVWENLYGQ